VGARRAFFAFAPSIEMIYTRNAVEALHRSLRKIIYNAARFDETVDRNVRPDCFSRAFFFRFGAEAVVSWTRASWRDRR
jgi:hypothetical protein